MGEEETRGTPRLLRHITRIQVKNFTPFPARDAFTSALSQPSEQSQFTAYGNLSDDLDVALARKRARKISSTSVDTMKSLGIDGSGAGEDSRGVGSTPGQDVRGRKRTISRASRPPGGASPGPDNPRRHPPISSSGSMSRPHRARTNSMASTFSASHTNVTSVPSTNMSLDHSQATLERVLRSRLIETFVSVIVPPPPSSSGSSSQPHPNSTAHARPSTPPQIAPSLSRDKSTSAHRKSQLSHGSFKRPSSSDASDARATKPVLKTPGSPSNLRSPPTSPPGSARKFGTGSAKLNGTHASFPTSSPTIEHRSRSKHTDRHEYPLTPNYLSPIHPPSTNPSFPLDPRPGSDLSEWTDLTATEFKVHLWGKARAMWNGRDKGKMKAVDEDGLQWRVMEEWSVHLADLVPLPEELAAQPSQLPFNTLLLTLSPPGKVFYLLSRPPSLSSTRPPSAGGYNSDPEVRSAGDLAVPTSSSTLTSRPFTADEKSPARPRSGERTSRLRGDHARSATWQDLVKLVTLQSVILDTQQSLSKVVRDTDSVLLGDEVARLNREISERDARITEWRSATSSVRAESDIVASRIQARREDLRRRKEALALAAAFRREDLTAEAEREEELARERSNCAALRNRLSPVRITLVSDLASIFPIDLLSGPDLLYTILDIPLPIPMGSTDPAPPLSLPSHKEVTEDGISTALAYAALVVQLLAVYLGRGLVYPITYIGSKSMIRDGISAMVGPRMFPLFSKGVDTYRFEYGVFLLNKDIEMLMSERNLRALDMRHTLPNLKNLLLTLTDGEGARLMSLPSPASSISGLESPSRPSSPVDASAKVDIPSISIEASSPDAQAEADSPPHSGSTTPSKASNDAQYSSLSLVSKPFFGLSGFLRARYPSSSQPSVRAVPEVPEGGSDDGRAQDAGASEPGGSVVSGQSEDDDDRRTLRGVPVGDTREDAHAERKPVGTGAGFPTEKDVNGAVDGDAHSVLVAHS